MNTRQILIRCLALGMVLATCGFWTASAQQTSASISGVVTDQQDAVIPGAKVILTDTLKSSVREGFTNEVGRFVFTPLQPSVFDIAIESDGFKRYTQTGIRVFASDRIVLPTINLELGAVAETVTVEGAAIQLQTQGAERSGVLTSNQVLNIAIESRNFFALAATVPGVMMTGTNFGDIYANGMRSNQNNTTVDGITNVDTGSNSGTLFNMNIDMISEFKIITNAQPAEIGRNPGAAIQVVTRSGTSDFHGTAYWFKRNESLNANNWRNNIDNRARQLQRQDHLGFNIGGPIYWPGKFNTNKDKLFFFASHEWQRILEPNNLRNVLVPTTAERNGDYSQTVESNGNPVTIRNPLDGGNPFANNQIPSSMISSDGQKILNFYPTPNAIGVAPDFNYQSQVSNSNKPTETLLRGDYNINDKWRFYTRYIRRQSSQDRAYGQWNADYNIPFAPMNFGTPGWSIGVNLATIIDPTLTNEFIFGSSKNTLNIDPVDDTFSRASLGLDYEMPFPSADPLGLVQNWRYNVPNAPFTGFNGTPFFNFNHTWDITDNISKVYNQHMFKFGVYLHKSQKDQTAFTSVNGNIWFDRDGQNPGDTNWAFSNALLGNYQRLQQSDAVLNGMYRDWNVEWYVQDSWKVTPKLTIDYGVRFYWIQPQYDAAEQTSSFNPGLYDAAARGILWQPFDTGSGVVARNPVTGETGPRAFVGAIVDTGNGFVNGLYANGMGLSSDPNYPRGLIDDRGIHYAPRIGIAWEAMEKTVIRTGAGVFYSRFQGNPVFDTLPNPPSTKSPTLYYGNLSTIGDTQGIFFPQNVRGFDQAGHVPATYNWNFSIQRELPGAILLDVGYVGMKSNHNLAIQDLNQAPFGSAWLPENQDPLSSNPRFDGTTTRPVNFYRPFQGFGETRITNFGTDSNYHSLQIAANRRLNSAFLFGVAYTWSKSMGTASGDGDTLHPTNFKAANYGLTSFNRTHNFVFNFTWELPDATRNKALGALINGWLVSGVSTFQTGQWDAISFNVQGMGGSELNRRITGSETYGPRVVVTGNPNGRGEIDAWIDPTVFAVPAKGSTGIDSDVRQVERPGINNWDLSIFKNIRFDESKYLQLRFEMFNAFNHTQFSDFNRTVQFDSNGRISNLPTALGGTGGRFGFGAVTSARDPRRIQLAAKFYF